MPREFIVNIDTANEQIERLDAAVALISVERDTALQERDAAITDLGRVQTDHDAVIAERESARTLLAQAHAQLDQARRDAVHAAAAAGAPPVQTPSEEDADKRSKESQLHGTSRVAAAIMAQRNS